MGKVIHYALYPCESNVKEQTLTYTVEMTCSGCSGAVERILKKLPGVDSYDVLLEKKTVVVKTESLAEEAVTTAIKKSGKETVLIS
ncbi:Cytosolic copper metallochaperone, partial [Nowakowskiella sp. JEL0078]